MNAVFNSPSVMALLRRVVMAGAGAVLLALTGCAAVAPNYQPTNDNVRTLQALPGGKAAVGQFTSKNKSLDSLSIRAGSYSSPYNGSYAEYLKAALRAELEGGSKFDAASPVIITGQLLENSVDGASFTTGTAKISARILVTQNGAKTFDKVVVGASQWQSSVFGPIAIPAARSNYIDTVRKLLTNLFADRDFQAALRGGSGIPSAVRPPVVTTVASPRYVPVAANPRVIPAVASRSVAAPGTIATGDSPPSVTAGSCEGPEYPRASRDNQEQGTVIARLVVGSNGHVLDIAIEKSSGFTALDKAARQAWSMCQFVPAMQGGVAVQAEKRMQYVWKLDGVAPARQAVPAPAAADWN
ncbi:MAG: energy transducer TonB [Collimonas sp.]|uniref:energy transducer TonB n=1 Tax=Collimonas sp. TaxID=1963772 RepID=UPI0032663EBB